LGLGLPWAKPYSDFAGSAGIQEEIQPIVQALGSTPEQHDDNGSRNDNHGERSRKHSTGGLPVEPFDENVEKNRGKNSGREKEGDGFSVHSIIVPVCSFSMFLLVGAYLANLGASKPATMQTTARVSQTTIKISILV
jgi:hypothetical protein